MALFAMAATAFLIKYVRLRKIHELVVGLVYSLGTIAFLVMWVLQLVGVMPR
jgi:hypothetical protein